MKIIMQGQLFIDGQNNSGQKDITIGKSSPYVDLAFESEGKNLKLRVDRTEVSKILEILDQGLM